MPAPPSPRAGHPRPLAPAAPAAAGATLRPAAAAAPHVTVALRAGRRRGGRAVPWCIAAGARRERGWCPRVRCRRSVRSWCRARCGAEEAAATAAAEKAAATAALPGPRRRSPLPSPSPALWPFPPLPPCLRASPSARGPWAPRRPPPPGREEEAEAGAFPSESPRRGNAATPLGSALPAGPSAP